MKIHVLTGVPSYSNNQIAHVDETSDCLSLTESVLLLGFRHYSTLRRLVLLLELITHLLHRHPFNAFVFVDVLNEPVYH